jgi:hypothetical protein
MSCEQNAGQNYNVTKANKLSESLARLKYPGTTQMNLYFKYEAIKGRRNSEKAGHYSVRHVSPSCSPYKNIKIKIQRSVTLSLVLYGCEMWSLTSTLQRRSVSVLYKDSVRTAL